MIITKQQINLLIAAALITLILAFGIGYFMKPSVNSPVTNQTIRDADKAAETSEKAAVSARKTADDTRKTAESAVESAKSAEQSAKDASNSSARIPIRSLPVPAAPATK